MECELLIMLLLRCRSSSTVLSRMKTSIDVDGSSRTDATYVVILALKSIHFSSLKN